MSRQIARACKRILIASALIVLAGATTAVAAPPTHSTHASRCAQAARRKTYVKACTASVHHAPVHTTKRHATPKPAPKAKPHSTTSAATRSSAAAPAATVPAAAPAPVASTAPCANEDLTPAPADIAVVEAATLCLVNQVRGENGLAALAPNADLQQSADQHNNDMVTEDYFAHNGPAGDTPLSRIQATGYLSNPNDSYVIGENIAWGTLNLSTPSAIVNAWVNSPDHLANILNPNYTDSGLSVSSQAPASLAEGQQGAIYTQDFGGIDNSSD